MSVSLPNTIDDDDNGSNVNIWVEEQKKWKDKEDKIELENER